MLTLVAVSAVPRKRLVAVSRPKAKPTATPPRKGRITPATAA